MMTAAFAYGAAALVFASVAVLGGDGMVAMASLDLPGNTAILLADGRVLVIAAGIGIGDPGQTSIYDPGTGKWTPVAAGCSGQSPTLLASGVVLCGNGMYDPKTNTSSRVGGGGADVFTSVLLPIGTVLGVGQGQLPGPYIEARPNPAELFDPATNKWSSAASMREPFISPRALVLYDGRVLVVGMTGMCCGISPNVMSAELYDPPQNTWSAAEVLPANVGGRDSYALALLRNGMALVAGGTEGGAPTSSTELFDPATGAWSRAATMTYARTGAGATQLPDGQVVVVGGRGTSGLPLATGEKFDPRTGRWVVVPAHLKSARLDYSAVLLRDGNVLVTGWSSDHPWSPVDAEVFDPKGTAPPPSPRPRGPGTWSSAAPMAASRVDHTATVLADGRVFVIGSGGGSTAQPVAQIYDPAGGQWSSASQPTSITSYGLTATLMPSGKVLVVGGGSELYDPTSDRWSPTGPMANARVGHIAALLGDGRVLVAGGSTPISGGYAAALTTAEVYTPGSNTWSTAGGASLLGCCAVATPLRDGRVLVISGANAETYDPMSNAWASVVRPGDWSATTTVTLLRDSRVLLVGGAGLADSGATQIFDPTMNSWSSAAPTLQPRWNNTATLLKDGRVLVAGGDTPGSSASAELYDPAKNRWTATGEMTVARSGHSASLLRNGVVLVTGGRFLNSLSSAELYTPPSGAGAVAAQAPPVVPLLGGAAALAIVIVVIVARMKSRRRA